jgi:hypothetical protein
MEISIPIPTVLVCPPLPVAPFRSPFFSFAMYACGSPSSSEGAVVDPREDVLDDIVVDRSETSELKKTYL